MDEKLKEKIYKILKEMPSENAWVDYKERPYEKGKTAKFIKLLNAFLNSIDSHGKDKFIIVGITNNMNKIGLSPEYPMQDDKDYQDMADKITPRPSIETGKIKYIENDKQYEFGYIYIPADKNNDKIYTINTDIPDETTYINDIRNGNSPKPRVYASTAWIRKGSVTRPLTEYDRRIIYDLNNMNQSNYKTIIPSQKDLIKVDFDNKIMKMLVLIGAWDENNDNDKKVISELIGQPYSIIVSYLRNELKEKNSILTFKSNKWIINNRMDFLKMFSNNYFKEDILNFQNITIKVLTSINPKFDLENNKRIMADLYQKETKFSNLLQSSISESLPMLSNIYNDFKNCKDDVRNISYNIIDKILNTKDWKLWASLDKFLPCYAEANPNLFLKIIERQIINEPKMIEDFMTSNELTITYNHNITGLYWALQLIAWQERYLVSVCLIIAKLSVYDKNAVNNIIGILLPWHPQTFASIEIRKVAIETILKENEEIGWKVIMELMPSKQTIGLPSYKPKWNNIIIEKDETINKIEYWKQIDNYLELILKFSKNNVHKLKEIIDLLEDVPKYMYDKIISKLSQKSIQKLPDESKYYLWDKLEDFVNRHTKYAETDWALPQNIIAEIKSVSGILKPKSLLVYNKRYFKTDSWLLHDDKLSYIESEKKLTNFRIDVLNSIFKGGLSEVVKFVKNVEEPYSAGICFSYIMINVEQENRILLYLDSENKNLLLFAKGFTYNKFNIEGNKWLEKFNIIKWNIAKKVNLLVTLPSNMKTWELVSKYLKEEEKEYWKIVNIRIVEKESDVNYPIKKLLEVKRPELVVDILGSIIHNKEDYDRANAIIALNDMLHIQDKLNNFDSYNIQQIIKDLQQSNISRDDLFKIEWAYLPLLNVDGYRPLTIEKKLSEEPSAYLQILEMIYKPKGVAKEECKFVDAKIATNAYRLIRQWKMPPGLQEDNKLDKIKLKKWYKEMKKICEKSDRLDVGLMNFGHVLFYSPIDKSGLWIDKAVAEILNADDAEIIRDGFRTECINSLGVVSLDKNGKVYEDLAESYEEKALSIEKAGYSRIANVMRNLADSYKNRAEETRERFF